MNAVWLAALLAGAPVLVHTAVDRTDTFPVPSLINALAPHSPLQHSAGEERLRIMGLRASLIRLSPGRLDTVLTSYDEWRNLDFDLSAIDPMFGGDGNWEEIAMRGIDKSWDGLLFLLDPARRTPGGSPAMPTTTLAAAVHGWHSMPASFGDYEDYIPRYNTAAEVADIVAALDSLDFDSTFAEHSMELGQADLYGLTDEDYLRHYIGVLRAFYAEAAQRGQAVITVLG